MGFLPQIYNRHETVKEVFEGVVVVVAGGLSSSHNSITYNLNGLKALRIPSVYRRVILPDEVSEKTLTFTYDSGDTLDLYVNRDLARAWEKNGNTPLIGDGATVSKKLMSKTWVAPVGNVESAAGVVKSKAIAKFNKYPHHAEADAVLPTNLSLKTLSWEITK